ncbi:MAG: hypothetical protein J6K75_08970, partial [Erysipelotrichaceae bacterium]|nr:hypothetical protein [Erysipelotrichaceae bacterium]
MKKMKMLIAMLIAAMLIVGCSSPAKVYQKGVYTGEAQGFGGAVVVEIEVSEDKILSAKVTADGETPTIGGAAAETLA